jgi:hypothetical protein
LRHEAGSYAIKDSGQRQEFESGMVRDVTEDKIDYALAIDGPMFKRYAIHLTNGAKKYAKRNWMRARGQEELDRFRESALRHMFQWYAGETDEDHMAAVVFNLNGAEYVREKMTQAPPDKPWRITDLDANSTYERWPDGAPT